MRYWRFASTYDAYNHCQTQENIKNGDALLIVEERVVGLAWTWPVAVTTAHGELHTVAPEGDTERLAASAGWTPQQIADAVQLAEQHGFTVNRKFWKAIN